MTEFLDREDVLTAGAIAIGHPPEVGDYGLLDAAIARPRSSAFGIDAYSTLHEKAAALMQSLARNHALVDGNKRTAWAACWVFLMINGVPLRPDFDADAAEKLVYDAAQNGDMWVAEIAARLASFGVQSGPVR